MTFRINKVNSINNETPIHQLKAADFENGSIFSPTNNFQGDMFLNEYTENLFAKYNNDFVFYTTEITLEKDQKWYDISKEILDKDFGIKKTTGEQIGDIYVFLKYELNEQYKYKEMLKKGSEITVYTSKAPENIPKKYQLQNYLPKNLTKLYPEDKYIIEADRNSDNNFYIHEKDGRKYAHCICYETINYDDKKIITGVHLENNLTDSTVDIDNKGNVKERKWIKQGNDGYWKETNYDKAGNKTVIKPVNPKYPGLGNFNITCDKSGKIIEHYVTDVEADKYIESLAAIAQNNDMGALTYLQQDYMPHSRYDVCFKLKDLSDTYDKIKDMDVSYTVKSKVLEKLNQLAQKEVKIEAPRNTKEFKFELNGEKLTIKNRSKNTEHVIDFNKLLEEYTPIERMYLKEQILKMNPQALEDLSIEVKKFSRSDLPHYHTGAYENPFYNEIHIHDVFERNLKDTITHELGHAVDFYGVFLSIPVSLRNKFFQAFKNNVQKYEKDGNEKYNPILRERSHVKGLMYCTGAPWEMFAECYFYLTEGHLEKASEDEAFVKYFSENIEITRQILDEIRKMPDEMRCRAMIDAPKDLFKQFYNIINIPPEIGF